MDSKHLKCASMEHWERVKKSRSKVVIFFYLCEIINLPTLLETSAELSADQKTNF